VSFREDAIRALRAGQNAEIGDANPYNGESLALAKCWQRGYKTMLTVRTAATPARQEYLRGRAGPDARSVRRWARIGHGNRKGPGLPGLTC
jgi:hypothetical protein